jgi:type I restriction enzyme, S subunit
MTSEWQTCSVDELVRQGVLAPPLDGNHGAIHPKASDFVPAGIPFIMASDMKDGEVDTTNCAFITEQQASTLRKGFAKSGDVLLSHKATIGRTALVGEIKAEYLVLTPQVTYYRVLDFKRLNNRYLKYYFDSAPFQQVLGAWAGAGSTRAYLGITAQRKLPVVLPPIELQNEIASVAGALDDRITLLRETNATLEAIAQALFKSWFVDFDPVRAKMEGRAPEGMDEATAALFPDSFEETELGAVPSGWRYSTVGESFVLTMGQSPPGDTYNESGEGLAFYQGRTDFGFRFPTQRVFCVAPTRISEIGDTLVSVRAPVGDVNMAIERCCIGRGVAAVRHPKNYRGFTFYAMQNLGERFKTFDSEGTVFGSINKKDFQALPVVSASERVLMEYDKITSAIDQKIVENEEHLRALVSLRDTLLPRLISGQLRLPEAETALQEAVA